MRNRMKKVIALLLVTVMTLGLTNGFTYRIIEVRAENGSCGENLEWNLDSAKKELTITGTGEMPDYGEEEGNQAPWYQYRNQFTKVIIEDGVKKIGDNAFRDCSEGTSVVFHSEDCIITDSLNVIPEHMIIYCRQGSTAAEYAQKYGQECVYLYRISYRELHGAMNNNPKEYTVRDTFTLNAPIREGYRFAGWEWEENGETKQAEKVTISPDSQGDRIYKAIWNKWMEVDLPFNSGQTIETILDTTKENDKNGIWTIKSMQSTWPEGFWIRYVNADKIAGFRVDNGFTNMMGIELTTGSKTNPVDLKDIYDLEEQHAYKIKIVIGLEKISQDDAENTRNMKIQTTGGLVNMEEDKPLNQSTQELSRTEYEAVVVPGDKNFGIQLDYMTIFEIEENGDVSSGCYQGEWYIESVTFEETDLPEDCYYESYKNEHVNVEGTPWTFYAQWIEDREKSCYGKLGYRVEGDPENIASTKIKLTNTVGMPEKYPEDYADEEKRGKRIDWLGDRWWWVSGTLNNYASKAGLTEAGHCYTGTITVKSSKPTPEDCFLYVVLGGSEWELELNGGDEPQEFSIPKFIYNGEKNIQFMFDELEQNTELSVLDISFTQFYYHITYQGLDGADDVDNPTSRRMMDPNLALKNPVKRGYEFLGWTGTGIGEEPVRAVILRRGNQEDLTYTAHWKLADYIIDYDLDGGIVSLENPRGYSENSDAITLTNPTKEGYEFAGWTGTELGETPQKDVIIKSGSTGDRTYKAHWTKVVTEQPQTTLSQNNNQESINIAKAKIKKVLEKKKSAKKVVVKIKKLKVANGFQFKVYKTKKKAKAAKKALVTKTIMKNRVKYAITHKKLKNKKTLFIRVRAVVKLNGTKRYGAWSKIKKIKIKK